MKQYHLFKTLTIPTNTRHKLVCCTPSDFNIIHDLSTDLAHNKNFKISVTSYDGSKKEEGRADEWKNEEVKEVGMKGERGEGWQG